MTNTVTPTQVAYPGAATIRTILQTVSGVILGAAAVVATIAILAPQFLEAIAWDHGLASRQVSVAASHDEKCARYCLY